MDFLKEYVFYNPNVKDSYEIFVKSSSECSYKYIHSYKPLDLIYSIRILDIKRKKTKNRVIKDIPIGIMSFLWKMEQKDISIDEISIKWIVEKKEKNINYLK